MNRQQYENLLRLADIMEATPEKAYDQDVPVEYRGEDADGWRDGGEVVEKTCDTALRDENTGWETRQVILKEGFCGTAACVMGTAALNMGDVGLGLWRLPYSYGDEAPAVGLTLNEGSVTTNWDIIGEKLFGMTPEESGVAFDVDCGSTREFYGGDARSSLTPKQVAKGLRAFAEKAWAERGEGANG